MRLTAFQSSLSARPNHWPCLAAVGLLLPLLCAAGQAQTTPAPTAQAPIAHPAPPVPPAPVATAPSSAAPVKDAKPNTKDAKPEKQPSEGDRRRAAKLFLDASKLFENQKFDEAMARYQKAADLDPTNENYGLAAEVARSHAVTAFLQDAAKDRLHGDEPAARAALAKALHLDPQNITVAQHLYELGDDALRAKTSSLYEHGTEILAEAAVLAPSFGLHSFHLHTDQHEVLENVFQIFGLKVSFDDSVSRKSVRLDIDDANFEQAARVAGLVTNTFYVPLDAHHVLIARDTVENRQQFERLELETIFLPALTSPEMTDVTNLAKNVFDARQVSADLAAGTITLRAPARNLAAFNATIRDIIGGHSQVLLDVRLIQIAHTHERNTGVEPPQKISAINVYSEEQSILNANQSLVQQIVTSGLAAPGDTLAILGILLASGQVTNSVLTSGVALFGGGLTASALAPGSASAKLNLNSSDSRELDQMQLRMGDGEKSTMRLGTRYPIQTSSYSSLSGSVPNIPGLTGAGTSSSLGSLLSSLSTTPNVPQVQYEDLGLTLAATPKVLRNDEVALNIELKIDALAGSSINGNPILDNRSYSGVVTLRPGEETVILSELDQQQSKAISGAPGLSEIPGLNNLTGKDTQKNYSTLVVVLEPHVVRGVQAAGHSPVLRMERDTAH